MLEENFTDILMPKIDGLILSPEKTFHLNLHR
jgi:hypothetical protein